MGLFQTCKDWDIDDPKTEGYSIPGSSWIKSTIRLPKPGQLIIAIYETGEFWAGYYHQQPMEAWMPIPPYGV